MQEHIPFLSDTKKFNLREPMQNLLPATRTTPAEFQITRRCGYWHTLSKEYGKFV